VPTQWYGRSPEEISDLLGATGYRAKESSANSPYQVDDGSAIFNGDEVNIGVFPDEREELKSDGARGAAASMLPRGVTIAYAIAPGAFVTLRAGDAALDAEFSRRSLAVAQSVADQLEGWTVVTVESTN
jgi:hypothetical protein